MASLVQEPHFEQIKIKKLAPTFAAEVEGVDFSQPLSDDVFDDILKAITKV